MRRCSIDGCDRAHQARGWCHTHYVRWRRHGDPLFVDPRTTPLADRFWSKVDKDGPDHALGRCWLWTGSRERYGKIKVSSERGLVYAHRVAYELLVGPVPDRLELNHLCGITHCVNPAHLVPATRSEIERRKHRPVAA